MRRLRAVLVATAAVLAIGALSRLPWSPPAADAGLLRLSWRMRGERIETCRPRTQAELDALPVHMRTPEVCDSRLLAYRLVLQVDDAPPDSSIASPGGARGDRPLFVLRDIPLEPGPHRVRVRFEREDGDGSAAPPLVFDSVLDARPGRIQLITVDPAARRLVMRH